MSQSKYQYVAVIGIDGMGAFNENAKTPCMDKIFENGSVNPRALSMDPTISAQNWGAMLLGRHPMAHGLTNGYISKFEYDNTDYPSLFTRIRRVYPDAYLTSVCNWNPINHGLIEHNVGVDLDTADNDEQLLPKILSRIPLKPKFLFVQFDDVDGAGHSNGYGTEGHIRQIEITDSYVGAIYEAYKAAGIVDETLFIVIADHGGIRRGHGGYSDGEKYVFFAVAGKNVQKGKMDCAATVDIAALVLYALGIEIPDYAPMGFSSRIPGGIFDEIPGYEMPEKKEYKAQSIPTPAFKSEKGLYSLFGDDIKTALFFDSEIKDETGNCRFTEFDTIKYYSDGVMGFRGEFGQTGCAATGDLKVGADSFSVAVWLKVDRKSLTEDCFICGNKDWWWKKRGETGWALVMKNDDIGFAVCDKEDDETVIVSYPDDFDGGWLHMIAVVDKENKQMRFYNNFTLVCIFRLPDTYMDSLDSEQYPFSIGNDASRKNNTQIFPNTFNMDDLIIFGKALTDTDIARLKSYYHF